MVSLHLSIKHQIHGFTLIKDECVNRTIQYSSSPETYLLPRRHSVCVSHVVFSCLSFYSWAPNQSLLDLKKGIYNFPALLEFGEHVNSSRMTYLSVNVAQYYLWHMTMLGRIIGCFVSVGIAIFLILLPSLRTSASMTGSSLYKELPLLTCFPCSREAISSLTHLLWFDIRAETQKQTHPVLHRENGHVNDYNFFTTLIDTCTQ